MARITDFKRRQLACKQRLRDFCEENQITQDYLAVVLDCSLRTANRWVNDGPQTDRIMIWIDTCLSRFDKTKEDKGNGKG